MKDAEFWQKFLFQFPTLKAKHLETSPDTALVS